MGETGAIYAQLVRAQGRAQASYRLSFWLDLSFNFIVIGADLITVLVVFTQVDALGGFSLSETLLIFWLSLLAFNLADLAVGNIERMRMYVRTGLMDTVLLRPLSALGQLLALDIGLRRIGRVLYALAIGPFALAYANVDWTPERIVLVIVAPLFGAMFFCAFFVATASVAFWWVESGEMANAITYGGRDFTSYPISVYGSLFRKVFAFGLGFAFVAYYPALVLLGREDPLGGPSWLGWATPAVALIAAGLATLAWRIGIRHYRSTGS